MRILTSLIVMMFVSTAALADSVSISVGEPGFYGRIVIGDAPPPVLIYREPILVVHSYRPGPPIYMHVPPGHAKNWKKHCHDYGACERRVYFVQHAWYDDVYVPHHCKHRGKGRGKG